VPIMAMVPFIKMHGLGNDFVVMDARKSPLALAWGQEEARAISDRHTGVGCDQFIMIETAGNPLADVFMRIRNADGTEVEQCGNATRCIAHMIMKETGKDHVVIETKAGLLDAETGSDGQVAVDMGKAGLDWRDIPLAKAVDTLHLEIGEPPLFDPVAVSIGNPHAVFFVDDVETVPLETFGPGIEHHPLFPQFVNVEVAQILAPDRIRMRVWERGVGITRACGTGACATVVAAHRRGLCERAADVILDGGTLRIEWLRDGHVLMTGPVAVSFQGELDPRLLKKA